MILELPSHNNTLNDILLSDPEVGFVDMNVSVSEGAGSVSVDIMASGASFVEVFLESGTATGQVSLHFSLNSLHANIHRAG